MSIATLLALHNHVTAVDVIYKVVSNYYITPDFNKTFKLLAKKINNCNMSNNNESQQRETGVKPSINEHSQNGTGPKGDPKKS